MNIAVQILEELGEGLGDYDGMCGELADAVLHRYPDAKILYVKPENMSEDLICGEEPWSYHMVAVVDGIVHDAWFPELMLPPKQYVKQAFPGLRVIATVHYGEEKETI